MILYNCPKGTRTETKRRVNGMYYNTIRLLKGEEVLTRKEYDGV